MADQRPRFVLRLGAKTLDLVDSTTGKVRVRIQRTDDTRADHALASQLVDAASALDAVSRLLQDGSTDAFGTFTYSPPPRAGADMIERLKRLISAASRHG